MKPWLLSCRVLLLTITLVSLPVSSQDSSEYDQWKQQFLTEFDSYKDELDREFSEFLKLEWKKFAPQTGIKRDPVPKPVSMPQDVPEVTVAPEPVPQQPLPEKISEQAVKMPAPVNSEGEKISLSFLGHEIVLFVSIDRAFIIEGAISQKSLQKGFDQLAKSDYENLVTDLVGIRRKLRLNDWAYMQLVRQFSHQYLPSSANSARLLSWFLLLKSGLKSRIAYAGNELYLLVSSAQPLYDITYLKHKGEKFYVISGRPPNGKKLYSYDGTYPRKLPKSDFSGISQIVLGKAIDYRELSFIYGSRQYNLRIPFNRHVIEFLSTYPQMHVEEYFNVAISQDTQQSLIMQLKPLVAQLSEREAVNFLLRLVQTGFDYKTDEAQFGKENYLFLEETIFYPSSDCEDRSIIFAWLVERLLGLEVVGLDFPGHVATAVQLHQPDGDRVNIDGKIFTIADPTYINASVGRKMPQYKDINPKVINYNR